MHRDQKGIGNEALMIMSEFIIQKHRLQLLSQTQGALTFQTLNGIGKGTAVLISRNLILTCAHNIYDKERGQAYQDFKFYLAVHGDSSHYYEIETYRFMEKQFSKCESRQRLRFEFALMKLKEDIERPIKLTNFLKLDLLCHQCQASKFKLSIYGYSSYCSYQEQPVQAQQVAEDTMILRIYQYGLTKKGRLMEINFQEQSLKYKMTTHPGQSGCPVVADNTIIAIHVGGGAGKSDYNIGRMITQEMIDIMRQWTAEMKAEGFEVHQHCHEVKYENKKLIIQQGQSKQVIVLEYNQHKHLTVQKIMNQYFKDAKRYQCLMYKSTVLFPQDTLGKIQSEPLFSNQQITLRFLKGSARLYFYRVVLSQYQDSSISNYNQLMTLPNKETHRNAYIKKVIEFYSKYYFYQMNRTLRAYDFSPKSEMLQMATELIQACSLLPKSLDTQVYRGVSKDYKNNLQKGQIVQFGEFLPTSTAYQEAYKHTLRTKGGTLFRFKSTQGSVLGDKYECAGKQVIMHLPLSNFLVEGISRPDKIEQTLNQEEEQINQANLVQIAGPITYRKDIILWICNRPEKCRKEWSKWALSGQIEVIHVPSVRFFINAWLPVYGWLLQWKQEVRVRILLYENSENLLNSLTRTLSRQQTLEEQNLGWMELLEELRLQRDDWTQVLFYTNKPKKYKQEARQRGLSRKFWANSGVEYVNRFVQFGQQSQEDPSESR